MNIKPNSEGLRQLSYSPTWRFEPILSPPVDSLPVIQRPWHLCHLAPTRHGTRHKIRQRSGKDPAQIQHRQESAGIGPDPAKNLDSLFFFCTRFISDVFSLQTPGGSDDVCRKRPGTAGSSRKQPKAAGSGAGSFSRPRAFLPRWHKIIASLSEEERKGKKKEMERKGD